jgi:hypothetical protein
MLSFILPCYVLLFAKYFSKCHSLFEVLLGVTIAFIGYSNFHILFCSLS